METIQTLLLVLQVVVAVALIGFILIQHGKGADAGAAFGSGASATVFGSRGSGNFLTRATTVLAIVFLANSLLLGYIATNADRGQGSLLDNEPIVLDTMPQQDKPVDDTQTATAEIPVEAPAVDENSTTDAPLSDIPEIPEQ